jgi:hypothetical protein
MKTMHYAALAALIGFATPALAQPDRPATSPPPTQDSAEPDEAPPPASSSATPSAGSAASNASVTAGMTVKDSTGASIGSVVDVQPDASGKDVATIAMGDQKFSVETSKLAVQNGSAMINATRSQIQQMLPKP